MQPCLRQLLEANKEKRRVGYVGLVKEQDSPSFELLERSISSCCSNLESLSVGQCDVKLDGVRPILGTMTVEHLEVA